MLNVGQNKKYCNLSNTKMENNNEFEKVVMKNPTRYYFDDINRIQSFDFRNIFENIYDVTYKPFHIVFNKVLLDPEKYDAIFNKIRYLIGLKRSTTFLLLCKNQH